MVGIKLFHCPMAKTNIVLISSVLFLSSEAFKRYFQSTFETDHEKTTGKYEVHDKTCTRQNRKREVRLAGFNRFPKSTHIFYISSNYRSWKWRGV